MVDELELLLQVYVLAPEAMSVAVPPAHMLVE